MHIIMISPANRQFIADHLEENIYRLSLLAQRFPEVDMDFAIRQIAGKQKAKYKIPVFFNHPDIEYPSSISMEQCSSEATALYKKEICHGKTFADLTGGFGIDSIFISPHFKNCYFIEKNRSLCDIVSRNIEVLNIHNIKVFHEEATGFLERMPPIDFIFLDPARRDEARQKVISIEQCEPNIIELKPLLLQKASKGILLKLSPMLDIKATLRIFPETKAVHVVAVNGECKELLFLLDRVPHLGEVDFHAVDIRKSGINRYQFTYHEEQEAIPEIATKLEAYLFEPNAAVLKAGAFKSLAIHYQLKKLHPHSHLYTSDKEIEDFPGRIFKIVNSFGFGKLEIGQNLQHVTQANVAVRNFPLSAEQLKKKLKLKDGGELYLFATTVKKEKHLLIRCTKI
ncbi:MAG: RsmD family RNA methyltransferase [Anaerovorax sp.]